MSALSSVELRDLLTRLEAAGPEDASNSRKPSSATPRLLAHDPRIAVGDLKTLKDALAYISADAPRGNGSIIGPDDRPVEDYWLGVILAVHREFGTAGEPVAREWSEGSARYDVEGFDKAWSAHDPAHDNPVTIRSVYKLAQAFGWSGSIPTSSPHPVPSPSRYRLLDRAAIMAIPPIEWRVKGLFPTVGLGTIYGPSQSGKSFVVLDLAINLALGQRWFGLRTLACNVIYVMLEGEAGLQNRLKAWEMHSNSSMPDNFHAIAQPFSFTNVQDIADLAEKVPKGAVIIIDTLNRAAQGMDENSSRDMGDILKGMKDLQSLTQGLVLFVHHTGKDEARGMRGHSSLYAALDGAIEVQRKGERRSWNVAKAKDGLDGQAAAFKLHVLKLGTDVDGEDITSCAISPDIGAVPARRVPTGSRQSLVFNTLRRALSTSEDAGMGGCGPDTRCMTITDAIAVVADAFTTMEKKRRLNAARSAVQKLLDERYLTSGFDHNEEAWLWYL